MVERVLVVSALSLAFSSCAHSPPRARPAATALHASQAWERVGPPLVSDASGTLTGFTVSGSRVIVALIDCETEKSHVCSSGGRPTLKALKELSDGEWITLGSYRDSSHWGFSDPQVVGGDLFVLQGWVWLKKVSGDRLVSLTGERGYSPAWPEQNHSFYPRLAVTSGKVPYVIWRDGDEPGPLRHSVARLEPSGWRWVGKRRSYDMGTVTAWTLDGGDRPVMLFHDSRVEGEDSARFGSGGSGWSCIGTKRENGGWLRRSILPPPSLRRGSRSTRGAGP